MRVSSLVVCMSISMSPPFLQPSKQLWRRACACERVALTPRVYAISMSHHFHDRPHHLSHSVPPSQQLWLPPVKTAFICLHYIH